MSETRVSCASGSAPSWKGDVVVVGCGPSALLVDRSVCRGRRVIAVNDAALRSFSATAVAAFSVDSEWVRRHRDFLSSHQGEKFVAVPLDTFPECGGIPGATYLEWGYGDGLSEALPVLNTGGNSGYAAINLAYLLGARRILLVGFDMDPEEDDKYRQWVPRFRTMLPQLAARGVEVLNLNPFSRVDAFPRVDAFGGAESFWATGRCNPPSGAREAILGRFPAQETAS